MQRRRETSVDRLKKAGFFASFAVKFVEKSLDKMREELVNK